MVQVVNAPRTGRVTRSPRHTFQLRQRPFLLQPFMIAPVLPGETMKSLLLQARCVTDPIANPLIGWWNEYYFFYVKHRDLAGRDDFSEMMLDLDKDMSAYDRSTASAVMYAKAGDRNWLALCLDRITEEYFRADDETTAPLIDTLPVVKINSDSVLNSAILDDNLELPIDEDVDANADSVITASEVDAAMRNWQFQRANNLTDMSYEDFLATYGIRPKPEEHHRPELIRYVRDWQYPSNTVDPATGIPSSAVSWAISERADKDRFFREPGFIVGVTVQRPKVYLRNQDSAVPGHLRNALDWLPAIMRDDPWTSMRKYAETGGPFSVVSDAGGYWLDVKDLFLYGDQFLNFAPAGVTNGNFVDLPTAGFNTLYPAAADIDALFTGTSKTVRQDGVVQLAILGALVDTTPVTRRG